MFKELPNDLQQQVEFYLQCGQFVKAKELVNGYQGARSNTDAMHEG